MVTNKHAIRNLSYTCPLKALIVRRGDISKTPKLEDVLLVIEEAHKAKSPDKLRQDVVYGVGTLMDSVSCVWTELNTDLFRTKIATTTATNINNDEVDVEEAISIFNQHVWQHPVVAHVINTEDSSARSMSDFLTRSEFKNLGLYRYFYAMQSIEDQLSVGYVENENVVLSLIHI